MNNRLITIICLLCASTLLFSCVGNKKYLAAKSTIAGLRMDSASLARQISDLDARIKAMEAANKDRQHPSCRTRPAS